MLICSLQELAHLSPRPPLVQVLLCGHCVYIHLFCIPCYRIQTRQADSLMDKRLVVAIDSWPSDSTHPLGHYVRTLGTIGDKDTETVRCEGHTMLRFADVIHVGTEMIEISHAALKAPKFLSARTSAHTDTHSCTCSAGDEYLKQECPEWEVLFLVGISDAYPSTEATLTSAPLTYYCMASPTSFSLSRLIAYAACLVKEEGRVEERGNHQPFLLQLASTIYTDCTCCSMKKCGTGVAFLACKEVVLIENDINFTPAVHECVPTLPWRVTEEHLAQPGRTDLRHLAVCSVDPPGCKDIDDALHVSLHSRSARTEGYRCSACQ
eukprot:scaffold38860_cov18-Tisochrysis_lutea.AAC.1